MVQVEHQHAAGLPTRTAGIDQASARLDQCTAIEQAGEPVGARQPAQVQGQPLGQHQGEPGAQQERGQDAEQVIPGGKQLVERRVREQVRKQHDHRTQQVEDRVDDEDQRGEAAGVAHVPRRAPQQHPDHPHVPHHAVRAEHQRRCRL